MCTRCHHRRPCSGDPGDRRHRRRGPRRAGARLFTLGLDGPLDPLARGALRRRRRTRPRSRWGSRPRHPQRPGVDRRRRRVRLDAPPSLPSVDVHPLVADGPTTRRSSPPRPPWPRPPARPSIQSRLSTWGARAATGPPHDDGRPQAGDRPPHGERQHVLALAGAAAAAIDPGVPPGRTKGFKDIAYNFVVDRFGRTWEGRAGGITNVVAAGTARGSTPGRSVWW